MGHKKTYSDSTELELDDVYAVVTAKRDTAGDGEKTVVNIAMTEETARIMREQWKESLPESYYVEVRSMAWAQGNELMIDQSVEYLTVE